MSSQNRGSQFWVEQLEKSQLPVLSGVIREINQVTRDDDSSVSNLTEIILKDAALTAKVLRVANSVYNKPHLNQSISTVSRAIVLIGFTGIRATCLTVLLVDSLLKKHTKRRMLEWMARGFHAAVQAEGLIRSITGEDNEDVFVSSLLLNVGAMAFWSLSTPEGELLEKRMQPGCASDKQIEREVLGTTLRDISAGLAEQWQLGEGLQRALHPAARPDRETQAVLLAERIGWAAEQGWDSEAFEQVLSEASFYTGMNISDTRQLLLDSADRAAAVAVTYGASKICHFIPSPMSLEADMQVATIKADPRLQLEILREIGTMVRQNVDVNTLFNMVVEGIHRGIGLERVCLCLVDPKDKYIYPKYVLGTDTQRWRVKMNFPIRSEQENLFAYCVHSRQPVWLRRQQKNDFSQLISMDMKRIMDTDNCMMMSLFVGKRDIGLLVIDRGFDGPDITEEQYESFVHFSQQTNMSLLYCATNGGSNAAV